MWKPTIKGLLAHKLRLALTALAIVLGVMFVSGTFVLTDTLHNTFTTLFNNVYQNVDLVVRQKAAFTGSAGTAVRSPIPESVANTVRSVPGVEYAAMIPVSSDHPRVTQGAVQMPASDFCVPQAPQELAELTHMV